MVKFKEFFKPRKRVIVVFLILIFFSFFTFNGSHGVVGGFLHGSGAAAYVEKYPERVKVFDQYRIFYPNVGTYLLAPVGTLFYCRINEIFLHMMNIPYLYVLACGYSYWVNKRKKIDKQ